VKIGEVKMRFDVEADTADQLQARVDMLVLAVEAAGLAVGEIDAVACGPYDRDAVEVESVTERPLEVGYLIRAMAFEAKTGEPIPIQLPARSIPIAVERHWRPPRPGDRADRWILVVMVESPPADGNEFSRVEYILHGVEVGSDQVCPIGRRLGLVMPEIAFGQLMGKPVVWWSNV
jgi:hypothetical protein